MGTNRQMKRWKKVWPQAIALSWKDDKFKKALLANPRAALAEYFDYALPSHIALQIYDPNTAQPSPFPPREEGKFGYFPEDGASPWVMPSNQLTLALPPKPANEADYGIALANFSDSNAYPFTTC